MTPCSSCPLRSRELFIPFTDDELAFMLTFKRGERHVRRGSAFLSEGESSAEVYTVLSGAATRTKLLADGQRQVVNFVFPGDFLGLQAGVMGEMKHTVVAATDLVLCAFRRDDLWNLFRQHPGRAFDVTWIAALEEHFLGETIATLGQRDAMERTAWALVRIFKRLRAVGAGRPDAVPFPFRQLDLADALGLSLVHTNKTLAKLRDRGLVYWTAGTLQITNLPELAALARSSPEPIERRPLI